MANDNDNYNNYMWMEGDIRVRVKFCYDFIIELCGKPFNKIKG